MRIIDPDGMGWIDVLKGATTAIYDNTTLGTTNLSGTTSREDENDYQTGQTIGNVLSIVLGGGEMFSGGCNVASGVAFTGGSGGTLTLVGGTQIGVGVAQTVHGGAVVKTAVKNLMTDGNTESGDETDKVHGNSKTSTKEQHGYEIKNNKTGEVTEYGVSGQELNKDGTSPRVTQKLRTKYGNNPDYSGEVTKKGVENRQQILDWEQNQVDKFTIENGQPPVNQKRPLPSK